MENKKSPIKVILIILLVIIFISSLGLSGYLLYDKYFKKEEVQAKKEVSKKIASKEVKLTDNTIKNLILENTEILVNSATFYGEDGTYAYEGSGPIFNTKDKIFIDDIKDDYKLFSTINYLAKNLFETEINFYKKDVDNKIKSVYGNNYNAPKKVSYCPEIVLKNINETDEEYFYGKECGGIAYNETEYYPYKLTQKEDEVYVYAAVAYINFDDLAKNGNSKIYTNLEKDNVYQEEQLENFKIDETNYQEFSKYKITFVKNENGDYIFKESVRIEK